MRRLAPLLVPVLCGTCSLDTRDEPFAPDRRPGPTATGATILPSGWALTPHGSHVEVGDFPLAIDVDPQERFAAVVLSGATEQGIVLVDLESRRVADRVLVKRAWLGGVFVNEGRRLLLSGGADDVLRSFAVDRDTGRLTPLPDVAVQAGTGEEGFVAGFDVHEESSSVRAYVALQLAGRLAEVDVTGGRTLRVVEAGAFPYTCLVSRDGRRVFVSLWGEGKVAVFDRGSLEQTGTIETGPHPNAMVESPDGRLFVACANDDTVATVDLATMRVVERIRTSLHPAAPVGNTPNALALARLSDGDAGLLVANADANALVLVEIGREEEEEAEDEGSEIVGFVPTGAYPTAVSFLAGRGEILVASGKGLGSSPNPEGPLSPLRAPETRGRDGWVGGIHAGTVSFFPPPGPGERRALTARAISNSPFRDRMLARAHRERGSPIPARPGDPSPIRYAIYVIKENRTYDQVLGGIETGDGDPRLVLFGPDVTPNHHAIARRWVLLDNTYADAEVSADGHQWSTAAMATDYTEKTWPTIYGPGSKHGYRYEGSSLPIVAPQGGYLWDLAARHGVSYRSYGEFVRNPESPGEPVTTEVPALVGRVSPTFRGYDLAVRDVDRAAAYLAELGEFERAGEMPRLQIVRLPNDHTAGTRAGSPTPRAMVADNDLALGRILEGLSRSRFWRETAVFVVEDDAQNGPDHVDAHRMVALVASPWAKRGFTDSTLYSTSAVLRTIELILGLPPMSPFDAATPMWNVFTSEPDGSPYVALVPEIPLDEKNPEAAFGQRRSAEMNLAVEDAVPEFEFNEILWKSVKGEDSPMPAPVRAPWVAWAEYLGSGLP
jgi:hypothetical protein